MPETLTKSEQLMRAYSATIGMTAFIAVLWGTVMISIGINNDIVMIYGDKCTKPCWYCQACVICGAIGVTAGLLAWPWSVFFARRPAFDDKDATI